MQQHAATFIEHAGANAQRMSFQRYVLATLLEEVLVAITLRLQVMRWPGAG